MALVGTAVLPSVGHGPRQPLRGRQCPPSPMQQRASRPPALSRRRYHTRATVIRTALGRRTRYCPHVTAPAKQVPAVPLTPAGTAAAEQPRSSPPAPPPSPAAPTQATAKLSCPVLNPPALSRLPCGTCTAPSVGAGWAPGQPRSGFRGVEPSSILPLLLPPHSANSSALRAVRCHAEGVTHRCGLPDSATCPAIVRSTTAEASRRRSPYHSLYFSLSSSSAA